MSSTEQITILDTTLRDGEQSPGVVLSPTAKVAIAQALEAMGVGVIEAGFPITSPGDSAGVAAVAAAVRSSRVCAFARCTAGDIEAAAAALKGAARPRIHTFIATSPIHMRAKLRMPPEQVVERAVWGVRHARRFTDDVQFSAEDAARSDPDFLCRVVEAVIAAGAGTVNIPDTVGYTLPHQYGALIRHLRERVPNADRAVFSVHCHDDLGMAVANSLAAVAGGARQVECTVNGIGERAGNAALEEVVMALVTRQDAFSARVAVETRQLLGLSRLVAEGTGMAVAPNKAIVGENAFAHEAGIHQDGVMKERGTYEIIQPEAVGWSGNRLQLGKHSGRNAFRAHMQRLGVPLADEAAINSAFVRFKAMADRGERMDDQALRRLVS